MKRIVVGIIDTGLDTKCKYFLRTNYEACSVKQDGNVSLLKSDYEDKNGHGTACASIIINECPNVEFFIINAFGESGKTNLVAIEKALKILKETSVDIINMSFAITTAPGNELSDLCLELSKNKIVVAAAANNYDGRSFPACYESVCGVRGGKIKNNKVYEIDTSKEIAIYILLKMQIGMFFVVFFLQLIVIWSQLKFTNILVEKTKKIRLKQDGIYASMQQYLGNIIVVILNKAKLLFFSEFVKKERSYQKECAELDIQYAVFDQIGSLFSSIIRVFIYTYGGMKIIKSQMTMGELIAFIEYTTLFINPCIRILKSNASIQKLKVSINRIYDFLEMKNSIAQNNYGIKIRNRINEIVFDNVSFSYDKKMVIENLSFKLERGKTYAFVGETGCGKSTIVNLLFRLWDTKSGNIMIDGENIKEYNLFSLRKQLSIATQNVYIKDDSIENNILMGRKKEDCAYDEICKLVGMESILSKFPKEKDVSVGENGNKLSGGQKQRIAMARALVHADNVLILDEATSALDNITQNEIMKNIKPLYQDKIVIIITHRLDTISDVDKIFVMSEGRICEEGQHNELMKKGEKYYALVQNL